jgi:hypothetical protein
MVLRLKAGERRVVEATLEPETQGATARRSAEAQL